jgi:hypothetical protein
MPGHAGTMAILAVVSPKSLTEEMDIDFGLE